MIKVLATDLHRLMKNSAIYPQKTSSYGQVVRISFSGDFLTAYSSDDFVYLRDSVSAQSDGLATGSWLLSLSVVKALEQQLRGIKDEEFSLDFDQISEECSEEQTKDWAIVEQLLEDSDLRPGADPGYVFAVAPDRLRKLSLIQPGDDPIDVQHGWSELLDDNVIALKIGKNTRLRIAPLDRAVINEKEEGLLWD